MMTYLIRRVLFQGIPVLLGFTFLVFLMINFAPGDPVTHLRGVPDLDPRIIEDRKAQMGLDRPLVVRYFDWLGQLLRGNLGRSFDSARRPVGDLIQERLPVTILLSVSSIIIGWGIGIPVGIYSARRQYTLSDYTITFMAFVGVSIPNFFFGMILLYIFALILNVLPAGGYFGPGEEFTILGMLSYLVMPAFTLGLASIASITRYMRSSLLEVIRQDYLRTARAKGLRERVVIYKHALRNALIPILTLMGFMVPIIFSGAVITEQVFSWPGLGRMAIDATHQRNYPVMMGITLMFGILTFLGNVVADVAYAIADPRIRYD